MNLAATTAGMLAGISSSHIERLSREQRDELRQELLRVYRIIEGGQIVDEAREATAPKAGVLGALESGERAL